MTQEEKELLLQDLCARLPYGVMIQIPELFYPQRKITEKLVSIDDLWRINDSGINIEHIKPFLRPMSSMTEEEYEIYHELIGGMFGTGILINLPILEDFLNKNMFDYRGLIEKGLAIAVTEENNPYEN